MGPFLAEIRRAALVIWALLSFMGGPLARHLLHLPPGEPALEIRIRLMLEALGTTYLKLGQFMAMRFDILPMEICVELRKLFEDVPALPFDTIRGVVETELGGRLDALFAQFDRKPLAAASIAQVHVAYSHRMDRLAVKVQRPGIATVFETDMRILGRIAAFVDWGGWFPGISAVGAIAEFASYTRREMDFVLEGRTADRLRASATANEKVPLVDWDLTTSKVLTMEFIQGLSVGQASRLLQEEGIDAVHARIARFVPEKALHNFATASLHQLFGTGFFHADPHPGNILLIDDNQIAFVDFGIFGILSHARRELLAAYSANLAMGQIDEAYRCFAKLVVPSGTTDVQAFKHETKIVLQKWHDASVRLDSPFEERHVGTIVGEIMAVLRRHFVRMDLDTLLFWRAAIALDSSALSLSPRFDLIREMRMYFARQRPGLRARVVAGALDLDRAAALRDVLVVAPALHRSAAEDMAAGRRELPISTGEAAARNKDLNREARALLSVLLAVSALPLALALSDPSLRTGAVGALLLVQFRSIRALVPSRP